MELLDKMDEQEIDTGKLEVSKEEINKKIEEAKKRIEELNEINEQVEKEGEISITDPEARHMKTNNNGTDICHNVQIAVDNKTDLVVAAPKEQGKKGYRRSDFKYDKEKDLYVCPNGAELQRRGIKEITYANAKACKNCAYKEECTQNKRGRRITISENDEILRENVKRHLENMEIYKTRQMIVEHVFGTVKRTLGFTHFLLRGNEKVKGESFMHFLIYNMKRVLNIMNIKQIRGAING